MVRRIALVAILAVVVVATGSPVDARSTVKLATLAPDGSVWHRALEEMAAEWQEITDGSVRVVLYPGGVSGDESDMIRKMRIGRASCRERV